MIRLLFFAGFRERLDTASEQIELDGLVDVGTVINVLRERGGVWNEIFAEGQTVMMAVNQEVAAKDTPIKDGDELAFFPPVTGG